MGRMVTNKKWLIHSYFRILNNLAEYFYKESLFHIATLCSDCKQLFVCECVPSCKVCPSYSAMNKN